MDRHALRASLWLRCCWRRRARRTASTCAAPKSRDRPSATPTTTSTASRTTTPIPRRAAPPTSCAPTRGASPATRAARGIWAESSYRGGYLGVLGYVEPISRSAGVQSRTRPMHIEVKDRGGERIIRGSIGDEAGENFTSVNSLRGAPGVSGDVGAPYYARSHTIDFRVLELSGLHGRIGSREFDLHSDGNDNLVGNVIMRARALPFVVRGVNELWSMPPSDPGGALADAVDVRGPGQRGRRPVQSRAAPDPRHRLHAQFARRLTRIQRRFLRRCRGPAVKRMTVRPRTLDGKRGVVLASSWQNACKHSRRGSLPMPTPDNRVRMIFHACGNCRRPLSASVALVRGKLCGKSAAGPRAQPSFARTRPRPTRARWPTTSSSSNRRRSRLHLGVDGAGLGRTIGGRGRRSRLRASRRRGTATSRSVKIAGSTAA